MSSDDDLVNVAVPARPAKRPRQVDGVLEFLKLLNYILILILILILTYSSIIIVYYC
jgi:hypothetical protein